MQPPTRELDLFLATLNDEADIGTASIRILLAAPISEWRTLLLQEPSLCRYGTFDALLQHGRSIIYSDPRQALAVVSFVLPYAEEVQVAPGAELLKPLLLGTAWKELANTHHMLKENGLALVAIKRALQIFEGRAELIVDRGIALLTYAQITHELADTVAALEAVQKAATIFNVHARPRRYLMALEICGEILMDQREYLVAQDVYRTASVVAEHLDDAQTLLRLDQARGACAVYLGDLDEATHYLTRAFLGFQRERMYSALQRAIWGIARVARERNELDDALEALHGVYAEFLHRGMLSAAAEVLVELGDVVTDMTGDVLYAREMSRRLAETMGTYDVPGNVREAVEYLHHATHNSLSAAVSRAAFAHVRAFLERLAGSPSTAFAAPL